MASYVKEMLAIYSMWNFRQSYCRHIPRDAILTGQLHFHIRDLEESMTGRRSNCVTKLTAGATRIAKLIEGRQPRERKKQNSAGSTEIKLI